MVYLHLLSLKDNFHLVDQQIIDVNRLLLRSDAFCINDPTCPFHTEGKGSVPQVQSLLLTLLRF